MKTKITRSDDAENFISPLLIISDHPLVERLNVICSLHMLGNSSCFKRYSPNSLALTGQKDYWPLGKIVGMLLEKDGCTRFVKLQRTGGEIARLVQRLFPLERNNDDPIIFAVGDPVPADRY
ncbi:hypothetical protein TNIN_87381 [Trichonephila inaurata madagascariensis]|uniref:Uncharacterized protein n=1 Tax=Trichonephila inaurata madagascariensis TaxID=2747483 RepID=A0A8X6YGT7_9ARAC|nr:hypothetical protein TNIN_87381 [Trichonephila inaurata madagascariensis]